MAEAMLLKCHAACAASSADPRACTLACAQRATSGAGAGRYPAGAHATPAGPHARGISPPSLSDAEAESILVECHGLCDPDGPVFKGLYAASGTRQQCTMDCAAARMHGESFVKGANQRTVAEVGEGGEGGGISSGGEGGGISSGGEGGVAGCFGPPPTPEATLRPERWRRWRGGPETS